MEIFQITKGKQFLTPNIDWGHPISENPFFRKRVGKFFDSNWPASRLPLAEYIKSEMNLQVPLAPDGLPSLELFFKKIPLKNLLNAITLTGKYLQNVDDERRATLKEFDLQKMNRANNWNLEIKNILKDLDQSISNSSVFGTRVGKLFDSTWPDSRADLAEYLKGATEFEMPTGSDGQPSLELLLKDTEAMVKIIILIEGFLIKADGESNRKLKGFGLEETDHAGKWNRGVKRVFLDLDPSFADGMVFRKQVGGFFDLAWPDSRADLVEILRLELGLKVPNDSNGQPSLELLFVELLPHYLPNAIAIIGAYLNNLDNEFNESLKDSNIEKSHRAGEWYHTAQHNSLEEKQRRHADSGVCNTSKVNFNHIDVCIA